MKLETLKKDAQFLHKLGMAALKQKISNDKSQNYVLETLGSIPGLSAKIAQSLCMGAKSKNTSLQFNPQGLPSEEIESILYAQLPDLRSRIKSISRDAYPASLGQIHKVVLKDGDHLAIKFQYPGIKENIHRSLRTLFRTAKYSPAQKAGLNLDAYESMLISALNKELDYKQEAFNQNRFYIDVSKDPQLSQRVVVPKVFPHLTTPTILSQQWVESLTLKDICSQTTPQTQRQISETVVQLTLISMFKYNKLHGDLHPRNWGYSAELDKVVLYDYGHICQLNPTHISILESAISYTQQHQDLNGLEFFKHLDFDAERLIPLRSRLNKLARVYLEPLANFQSDQTKVWNFSTKAAQILGDENWLFRAAGPPWFFMFMRSLQGVYFAVKYLKQPINFPEILKRSGIKLALSEHHKLWLKPTTSHPPPKDGQRARFLKVLVKENDEEIVKTAMPICSLDSLEALIPTNALIAIKSENIDLKDIVHRVRASHLTPQTLFEQRYESQKTCKVWIE